jgi:uncharacterized protein
VNAPCCPDLRRAEELVKLVSGQEWLATALRVVAASGLPAAWVGAGVLRDLVWGELHGGFDPAAVHDIDVPYFDPAYLSLDHDLVTTRQLAGLLDRPWETCNQAAVHTWYHEYFGGSPVAPLTSVHEGAATGPETATSVAVRVRGADLDTIEVCAPHGLDDLLDGVWRHNPARVSVAVSRARLRRHRIADRWPNVVIVAPTG